jgi:hypothetical protein
MTQIFGKKITDSKWTTIHKGSFSDGNIKVLVLKSEEVLV